MAMEPLAEQALFQRVHAEFSSRGLLGRPLRLTLDAELYRVICDDRCFSVYRINSRPNLPPGVPGWTVCRLSAEQCLGRGAHECQAGDWLEHPHLEEACRWVENIIKQLGG
jgi:NifB/MoaA-like Fe-S oxidoreductase